MRDTVVHTEASRGWGGQEIRTLAECRWFREQGYRVVIVAAIGSTLAVQARDAGFEVHLRTFRRATQLKDTAWCRKLFQQLAPLLVASHSNIDTQVALAAAAMAGVPNRFRYRHVPIPVSVNPWNRFIYRRLATRVITTAESIAAPLRANFDLPHDRVQCVFSGVDAPSLPARETARLGLADELGLPTNSRFIGQVSVLRRGKGHEYLMRAFDQLANDYPQHHLVLFGGGHGSDYLPPIAAALPAGNRILFAGHRVDPWPCYRALDVSVLASDFAEGIPQVAIQSMLAEVPFVGTRAGGTPEVVEHDLNGLLVDAASDDQLASALRRLLADPALATQLASNGRDWATREAGLESMGRKIEALLVKGGR